MTLVLEPATCVALMCFPAIIRLSTVALTRQWYGIPKGWLMGVFLEVESLLLWMSMKYAASAMVSSGTKAASASLTPSIFLPTIRRVSRTASVSLMWEM